MTTIDTGELISGDALKAAALRYLGEMRSKVEREQSGLRSIFDNWFTRVLTQLTNFDPTHSWEESVQAIAGRSPAQALSLQWDLQRLRQFLDRWRQGRFVDLFPARAIGRALLSAVRHRVRRRRAAHLPGRPIADALARHTADEERLRFRNVSRRLIAELRPRTVFEIGSGLGASAVWFADHLTFCGVEGRVHSVDRVKVAVEHPRVEYLEGDCSDPEHLFDA